FVAVLPGDLVGQWLGGEEKHLVLAGELGDREADVGQERAGEHVEALAGHELLGDAHSVPGIAAVVARDELELLAEQAARGVDLLDREIETLLVGLEKRRLGLVAVELPDPDRLLGRSRTERAGQKRAGKRCEQDATHLHDLAPVLGSAESAAASCRQKVRAAAFV